MTGGDPATSVAAPRAETPGGNGDALYRGLLHASSDPTVFVFGSDLRYILAGGVAFERLGWRLEDIVGRRPSDLLSDGSGTLLEEQMRAALAGESRVYDHVGIRDADAFWRSTIAPVRDDAGTVVAGLILSRDVAPVRAAER